MIFANIFIVMFNSLNLFTTSIQEGENFTDANGSNANQVLYDISGNDFGDIFGIIFVDIDSDILNILATVAMLGAAAFFAYLTKSPAPLVVAVVANVFKNTYVSSMAFLEQFPINNYLMLAGVAGMLILFVVTCLESLTHGEA